ncbi:YceI family protein [Rhodococcus sp. 2H158]
MSTALALPGLTTGTWVIDPTHSTVGFSVRHLVVSKVRGTFNDFSGVITVSDSGEPSVEASVAVASIDTRNADRDAHIRDFGISIDMPLEGGGAVVGDKITLTLEIEAVLQP